MQATLSPAARDRRKRLPAGALRPDQPVLRTAARVNAVTTPAAAKPLSRLPSYLQPKPYQSPARRPEPAADEPAEKPAELSAEQAARPVEARPLPAVPVLRPQLPVAAAPATTPATTPAATAQAADVQASEEGGIEPAVEEGAAPASEMAATDVRTGRAEQAFEAQQRSEEQETGQGAAPAVEPDGRDAALASLGETLPAQQGAVAGGEVAGGGEAPPESAAPDVSGLPPAQGLAALCAATPAQVDAALGGVQGAAASETAAQAQAAQAGLPEVTVGEPAAARPAGAKSAAPAAPVAVTLAGKASDPSAAKAEPASTPPAAGNAADRVATPQIARPAAEPSAADKARLGGALSALPGSDPGLQQVSLGPAPQLQLSGAADPALLGQQQSRAEQAVAAAHEREVAAVARPLGEQHVRPTVGQTRIKARVLRPAGAASGKAAPGKAGALAQAILAEQLRGAEVRVAMAVAAARVSAATLAAQAQIAASNQAAQSQIGALTSQAAAEQQAAGTKVRADAQAARARYTAQQQAALGRLARGQVDILGRADTQVAEEKSRGEQEAAAQIEQGEQQTRDKQAEVETAVATKKREAQAASEEKGFFGRLGDAVGAWFDGVKQWISDKVEAGKAFIRATAERFKRYAAQKIDAARERISGLIAAAGTALAAAADVLLASFPAAREAVQGAISAGVDWGISKSNAIAEGAKRAVNRVVDGAAAVAEFALETGGKLANAAIDQARAITVGALKAADKVAQALGVLKTLVEDVAPNPGGWIAKLGAAAREGVRQHLAGAMATAIRQWWEGKLQTVLGVGPAIWALLKQGGLGLQQIGAMAWSAIKAVLPPALIQLLIEKLVAMIIPAAGAVIAVIEGLQAAWGSVSAMLGAVGRAIAFLKAVKGGGAGPQFAQLVAAAAIVVIDFVSNWLLLRLGKAILKIGGKIKGIARQLRARLNRGRHRPQATHRKPSVERPKTTQTEDKEQARREAARRRTRQALSLLVGMKAPLSLIRKSVAALKRLYRWGSLELQPTGQGAYKVVGGFSPASELLEFGEDFTIAVGPPRLTAQQRKDANASWRLWEGKVAMPHVDEVIAPNLARQGLSPSNQQMIHHPADPKVRNKPEAIFTDPARADADQTEVTLIEATLNASWFATNSRGARQPTGQHKIIQIPQTLFIALNKWPRARIRYIVICSQPPGATTKQYLQSELGKMAPGRLHITWLVLG
ncbi:hypothetical protein [Paucibacter sp. M5-1]|uniref:hypothetical protein n=1 Tax=Paucibacter sp. M5-1 TaxID=3015998 RepID=UPI003F7F0094